MYLTMEKAERMMERRGGDLILKNSDITELPEDLYVAGDLKIINTPITELPWGLYVEHNLIIQNAPIQTIHNDLTVGGHFDISKTSIRSLPDDLYLCGDVSLPVTLEELPENFTVGGTLSLKDTPLIKYIPKSLMVYEGLDLCDSMVEALPHGYKVGGYLTINHKSMIKELPENLIVGCGLHIGGTSKSGKILESKIKELPAGLTVGMDCTIFSKSITKIPNRMTIGGDFTFFGNGSNERIPKIPRSLRVGGRFEWGGEYLPEESIPHRIHDGDYVPGKYIACEGAIVPISRKPYVTDEGHTVYEGRLPCLNVVSDGKDFFSICNDIMDGIRSVRWHQEYATV